MARAVRQGRTPAELVADLPASFGTVGWFGGDKPPLLGWLDRLPGGRPPCVEAAKSGLEGYLQASQLGASTSVLLFEGRLDRDRVEACLSEIGDRLGVPVSLERSGRVTLMSSSDGKRSVLGWTSQGGVVWHGQRAVVEEVLARRTNLGSNAAFMSLVRRVAPASTMWLVSVGDYTQRIIGVPSDGLFLSGDLTSLVDRAGASPPALVVTFAFGSPPDAARAAVGFKAASTDARFSEALRHSLERTIPTAKGSEVEVDVTPLVFDAAALEELVAIGNAAVAERQPSPPSHFAKDGEVGGEKVGMLRVVYAVDLEAALDDARTELARSFEAWLGERKINAVVEVPRLSPSTVYLVGASAADRVLLEQALVGHPSRELVKTDCPKAKRDRAACLEVSREYADLTKSMARDKVVRVIKDRVRQLGGASPVVRPSGDRIVVDLWGLGNEESEHFRKAISCHGKVEFVIADSGSAFMDNLVAKVAGDAVAKTMGIEVGRDSWTNEETGQRMDDVFLSARDREVLLPRLEAEAHGCARKDSEPAGDKVRCELSGRGVIQEYLETLGPAGAPDDLHRILFEQIAMDDSTTSAKKPAIAWRTYYLSRTTGLTGRAISGAEVVWDPAANRPEVWLTLDAAGTRSFGELTSKNIGRKLAIVIDDNINSAPVIMSAIRGGRVAITMGRSDAKTAVVEAADLAAVVRAGALPVPIREESSSWLDGSRESGAGPDQ